MKSKEEKHIEDMRENISTFFDNFKQTKVYLEADESKRLDYMEAYHLFAVDMGERLLKLRKKEKING